MANTKELVKGYLGAFKEIEGEMRAYHIAVFANGVIKMTHRRFPLSCTGFNNRKTMDWNFIDKPDFPADAEFIGNYPANM